MGVIPVLHVNQDVVHVLLKTCVSSRIKASNKETPCKKAQNEEF